MEYGGNVRFFFITFCLSGCVWVSEAELKERLSWGDEDTAILLDGDDDGFTEDEDCNDANSLMNPGMAETCDDGVDQDCDGTDEVCADHDADGWSAEAGDCDDSDSDLTPEDADGDGYSTCDGDCDDTNADYHPDASEPDCTDPNDYNCDGSVAYADADSDGYLACQECDDSDNDVNPGVTETWYDGEDADCSGGSDFDADGDGYESANFGGDDCDDLTASTNPDAYDACDDIDNDCSGTIDDDETYVWYLDQDGDGYGDAAWDVERCDAPDDYVSNALDCDDENAEVSPISAEVCDGIDNDCDGTILADEVDSDADGVFACEDCDDTDENVYPGAMELCGDGIDNDCDSSNDTSGSTWYADADGDGYGDVSISTTSCTAPTDYVTDSSDCDDTSNSVYPGADEYCDGSTDEDCDGSVDENSAVDAETWYADTDVDGYGDSGVISIACEEPAGYVSTVGDCDDANPDANPGEVEVCDGTVDEDCDGSVDERVTTRYYEDADADSWGNRYVYDDACSAPTGYVTDNSDCDDTDATENNDDADADDESTCEGDCDDTDATLDLDDMDGDGYSTCTGECNDSENTWHPGATEVCDGYDNDCDSSTDEGLAFSDYYADSDSDGYGDSRMTLNDCAQPSGYVENDGDCNDSDYNVNPDAIESCNLQDDDCDSSTDEGFDADGDGSYDETQCSFGDDCDDADATVYSGATEACDAIDNDCDDQTDEDFDLDSDGYVDETTCSYGTDCDDTDPEISPDAKEVEILSGSVSDMCSDGLDQDCDGNADSADWDCDDEDLDGIENGIDAIVAIDDNVDGDDDTICLVAISSSGLTDPFDTFDTIIQGDAWGDFDILDSTYTVTRESWADSDDDGTDDVYAWCHSFITMGPPTSGSWNYRFVSAIAEDESSTTPYRCGSTSSTTWVPMDIADFCTATSDGYCRAGYAAADGCSNTIGTIIRARFSFDVGSIAPY